VRFTGTNAGKTNPIAHQPPNISTASCHTEYSQQGLCGANINWQHMKPAIHFKQHLAAMTDLNITKGSKDMHFHPPERVKHNV
jgi:hypothetical protein